jgi:hypothetical protein
LSSSFSGPYKGRFGAFVRSGYFPFMNKRLQVVEYSITEGADWIAFSPKIIGTSLLAGVNIMDKSATKIRVATKDDRRIGASSERP